MSLVHHCERTTEDVVRDAIEKLVLDAEYAKKKSRFRKGCWLRFAVTPKGVKLYGQLGTPSRPYQSNLVLDHEHPLTDEMVAEIFGGLKADRVMLCNAEWFKDNPLLGIHEPYYEFTLEVRRY